MSAVIEAPKPGERPDLRALEQFLYYEARLIDEWRWEQWQALWTDDGEYWVPASPGQPDPVNHLSLIYERSLLRAVRIKRFHNPLAQPLQPKPRSLHVVGNVMLEEHDPATGECVVTSKQIVLQYRRDKQDVFGGTCTHRLVPVGEGWKMRLKKFELVNCDAMLENILLYL